MNTEFIKKVEFKAQKLIGYGLWLLVIILGFSVVQNASKMIQTKVEIQKEREKVDKIKEQNEELEKKVSEAQSSAFIEKQVRDKLGLARIGEAVVVLPDEDVLRSLAPHVDREENFLPDPNWRKWLKLFL